MRDIVHAAVGVCARVIPRAEDGTNGFHQLCLGVLREIVAQGLLVVFLEQHDQFAHIVGVQFVVLLDALLFLDLIDKGFKGGLGQFHYNIREHLDEAAVGVARKARVIGQLGNSFADLIVHTQVQDGVHHAGHGSTCARAHGNEQRTLRIAQSLAGHFFEFIKIFHNLFLDIWIDGLAILVIPGAGFCGDGEALRHRHAEIGHFGQICALAAEQLTHRAVSFREQINKLLHCWGSSVSFFFAFCLNIQFSHS